MPLAAVDSLTARVSGTDRALPANSVSVIIPARNAAATIARTLRSLAPDAGLIGEVVLVDDGSTDQTIAIATSTSKAFELPIRLVSAQAGSAGAARNLGLETASGDFVYFVDSDDEPMPGCLHRLVDALANQPDCGIAIGANIRRTAGRIDKTKSPAGFTSDLVKNAESYLRNRILPIAMGSALVRRSAVGPARFPEKAGLDEDTIFWAAVLTHAMPATVPYAVLVYHHDESRMKQRFLTDAGSALRHISEALDRLAGFGVGIHALEWRKAWISRRIARELVHAGRYTEAASFLKRATVDPVFARSSKAWSYKFRIALGRLFETGNLQATNLVPAKAMVKKPRNFLLVSADCIYPPVSGSDQRNWALAKSLSRHGAVTVASFAQLPADIAAPDGVKLVSFNPDAQVRGKALRSLRARIETRVTAESASRLNEIVTALRPDLTMVSGIPLFGLLDTLAEHGGRVVLDMQNVESALQRQHAKSLGTFAKLRLETEVLRTAWLENRAAGKVAAITACSRLDRDHLVSRFRRRLPIHVLPNILPHMDQMPLQKPVVPPVILFIGHLGYRPNVDAAMRLAKNILPLIAARLPSARLVIAGRFPRPEIKALDKLSGVTVVVNPPGVADLYARASVAVMPIASGGGTRIKILEAMALGVPVVATSKAAEGLDLAEGLDFIAGQTDRELADAAISLLERPEIADRIAGRARKTAHAYYSAAALDDAIDAML